MTQLSCPKCPGSLSRETLVGVTVDKCSRCRGLFLDRGELEQLLEAEHRWRRGHEGGYNGGRHHRGDEDDDAYARSDYQGGRRRRQASFLDEIFD
ncbi:TFIIB-type zinc ribbon-containing protein [Actinorugispora endophytica]|uniref:Zn-finger nucleic acid-binding protein n=1 Tax=Actinorugispora endophytica TaxID=1605990 RepID=A0A4R6ULQ3_9ACTN|nr:zf-TFIIB domain-containing protein [Actinorugispora endophytica]TDQ47582.1 Zn-finger nucleic acid-binding protein [Actinorugispora endophytica]